MKRNEFLTEVVKERQRRFEAWNKKDDELLLNRLTGHSQPRKQEIKPMVVYLPYEEEIVAHRASMDVWKILAFIGLIAALVLLLWLWMPEKEVKYTAPPKEVIHHHYNTTTTEVPKEVIKEKIITTKETEELPPLGHRGSLWCNGQGRCYVTD